MSNILSHPINPHWRLVSMMLKNITKISQLPSLRNITGQYLNNDLLAVKQLCNIHYYSVYPFLCASVTNFAKDRTKTEKEKECYVSFTDVPTRHKVRELSTAKIGTLIRISGQVVRTHPVHPELINGAFVCLDCQTEIRNIEQQFKVTQN